MCGENKMATPDVYNPYDPKANWSNKRGNASTPTWYDMYGRSLGTAGFDRIAYINNIPSQNSQKVDILKPVYDEEPDYEALKQDIDDNESLLRRTMRANGVYQPSDMRYWTTFYRFPRIDPFNYVDGAREYTFFTKPDLPLMVEGNLSESASIVSYYNWLYNSGYRYTVLENLCASNESNGASCPFVRILTNRKTSNIDIPDISVEEMETAQNLYGTKMYYPKSSMQSDENADFSVEFEDTRFLEIYNYFKAWDYYRQLNWLGLFNIYSMNENRFQKYIINKILFDHISVFKFLVDNDGETILHFSKYTGVYPRTISRSSFSEIPNGGPLKITVGFKSSGWFDDMNPDILDDFNALITDWLTTGAITNPTEAYLWDEEIEQISGENVDYPYIEIYPKKYQDSPAYNLPKLKWGKFVN